MQGHEVIQLPAANNRARQRISRFAERKLPESCQDQSLRSVVETLRPLPLQIAPILDYGPRHTAGPHLSQIVADVDQLRFRIGQKKRYSLGEAPFHLQCAGMED